MMKMMNKTIKMRGIMKSVDNSIESGNLTITTKSKEKEKETLCPICNKKTSMSTCYSWFILNDEKYEDIIEMLFCSKKCWKKYLENERGKK
jgi:hypothetical protein